MTDLVDQMFPPIHRHMDAHFTDFNFWRQPMDEDDLPELTPPSPALSARSDTSNQSTLARLRNMNLMGNTRTGHKKQYSLPPPTTEASIKGAPEADEERERGPGTRDSHLRQMSSFERLSNTLSNFVSTSPSAASPISSPSDSGDEDEDIDLEQQTRGRIRIRRTSMPGSLPGNSDDERHEHDHGDEEYGEAEEEDDYDDNDDDDEHEEQRLDEDIFATGEMENVPFL
jgi:phosphatidate phosphatase LPIN